MEAKDNENKEKINENIQETKNITIETKENAQSDEIKNETKKRNPILGALKRIIIVVLLLAMAIFALKTSKYYTVYFQGHPLI